MRELEQEQFRLFCQAHGIGTTKPEEIVTSDEPVIEQASSTLV